MRRETSDSNEHRLSFDSRRLPLSSSRPSAERNDIFLKKIKIFYNKWIKFTFRLHQTMDELL